MATQVVGRSVKFSIALTPAVSARLEAVAEMWGMTRAETAAVLIGQATSQVVRTSAVLDRMGDSASDALRAALGGADAD